MLEPAGDLDGPRGALVHSVGFEVDVAHRDAEEEHAEHQCPGDDPVQWYHHRVGEVGPQSFTEPAVLQAFEDVLDHVGRSGGRCRQQVVPAVEITPHAYRYRDQQGSRGQVEHEVQDVIIPGREHDCRYQDVYRRRPERARPLQEQCQVGDADDDGEHDALDSLGLRDDVIRQLGRDDLLVGRRIRQDQIDRLHVPPAWTLESGLLHVSHLTLCYLGPSKTA